MIGAGQERHCVRPSGAKLRRERDNCSYSLTSLSRLALMRKYPRSFDFFLAKVVVAVVWVYIV